MTPQEQKALRAMSESEIRRAQDIVKAQIPLAFAQRNTDALTTLQAWELAYADELAGRVSA